MGNHRKSSQPEVRKNLVRICFDEDIAFKIDDYLVIYYFAWGKFLARVIKGGPPDTELPKLLPH